MQTTKEKTMKTKHVSQRFRRFARANEAVSALEYAILVGIIAVGIGLALTVFETKLSTAIEGIAGRVNTGAATTGTPALANN